jgi:hypothetical protein
MLPSVNGFVASIFFAFFKVFLAILFPPRLICPVGHLPVYMQSNRQTSPPIRQSATCSIHSTSLRQPRRTHPPPYTRSVELIIAC